MTDQKTHYRKAFDSPYLSAADLVEPTVLTVARVQLERDKTKKTSDSFNTIYWTQKELRPGEELKPMILNATNSKTMKNLTGTPFIEEWAGTTVTVYVDQNVKFGRETVEGLRISTEKPRQTKPELLKANEKEWKNAVARYKQDGTFDAIEKFRTVSDENKELIKAESAETLGEQGQ